MPEPKARNRPPFSAEESAASLKVLDAARFPLSPRAQELRNLGIPTPYATYTYTAGVCLRALQDESDPRRLIKASRRAGDAVDRVIKWIGDELSQGRLRIACKAGCNYCCSIRANAVSAEIASIVDFINSHFGETEKTAVKQSVEKFVSEVEGLTPVARWRKTMLCPLNRNGLCSVYDVRPILCRSYHSFSVQQCKKAYTNWENGDLPITSNAVRKMCCDAALFALEDACDFMGFDRHALELPEAMKVGLDTEQFNHAILVDAMILDQAFKPEIDEAAKGLNFFVPQLRELS